ncbi:MAG: hypothetical protein IT329_05665 [Caldilineaceae bacterium]|nr:hypothetical protein [Caldilineaceae bacterium]
MTWPFAVQFTTAIPGDGFDGWQNYWNLWWIKLALVDRLQSPYITDLLYYPTGVNLYFHTLNPFNGLTTLPVQLAAGLLPAYNTAVLLSWVLGGYGMFLLVRWLLGRVDPRPDPAHPVAAFVAGAIYTFAPFHMAHLLGHMQVMSLQWLPFYLLDLLAAMERSRGGLPWIGRAGRAGFFLALAGLCDWYFVLYLFLFTALAVIWQGVGALRQAQTSRGRLRRLAAVALPAALAGGVFALLLSPILIPMVDEARRFSFMVRPSSDLYILSASLLDFLVPNRMHTLLRPESFTWPGNQIAPVSERTISIGYAALLLAGAALWRRRGRAVFWAAAALLFVLLAMGPRLHVGSITWADIPGGIPGAAPTPTEPATTEWTPYALLNRYLPFMRISRSVSRWALLVQISVAALAGLGLAAWLRGRSARQVLAIGALALGGVLAEDWVAPYPHSPPDTPGYYTQLAATPGPGALLNLPMNYDRPGYLLYQTVHQRPLTVAYISRDDPRTLAERAPVLQHFRHLGPDIIDIDPAQVGSTVLADLGVEKVVLDRYKMPGGLEREYTSALAASIFAGQAPDYEDERLTAYSVQSPAAARPYLVLGPLGWGPLQEEGEARRRAIGPGPAALTLHHLPADAALRITYQTAPGVSIDLLAPDGARLATLPPAPQGDSVTVPLVSQDGGAGAPVNLTLMPSGDASITGLGLALP